MGAAAAGRARDGKRNNMCAIFAWRFAAWLLPAGHCAFLPAGALSPSHHAVMQLTQWF